KSLLESLFKRFGIRVNGSIHAGIVPRNSSVLAIHESEPLETLINEMLKMSDNVIAGSIFKKMGEMYTKQPGSWENGSTAVKQILASRADVDTYDMRIIDGSGLSPNNEIKPVQMIQVLDFAYHNNSTNYVFISALPIAGVDGTLKHRLYNVARKVRAKTGTMAASGVVSLAGYVVNKNKEPFAFVIIVNGRTGSAWRYREMEDKIITALSNYVR
ncbi:MAG TPA: D-alanyl-D-alanine carboxypeptidase/D-alanyl-D-alanine-endopeptidase, partial [Gammaproteobacteria bacterium]|nr:D-alanyl-D-alanine carboxypeptidase/D-alanyl-D-alanine-endopeptidase [Gammaproteobacteria bacterium]